MIVQLAAHLLSYGKLIHQTVPFRNQGWRAGAATMPALNSRLVWRHPVPIFAKTNQICSFLENNPRKRIPSGWDWVGGAANVLGLWTGLLSPHPPHTHEEASESRRLLTGIKIHRSNPTSLVAPVSSTSNMQVSTDIHKTKKHNLFPKKRKKEKSEE